MIEAPGDPATASVRVGAQRLAAEPTMAGAGRLGLFTNDTGVMPDLGRSLDALLAAGVPITTLFAPEHGLRGSAQAGRSEAGGVDEASALPVVDTYGLDDSALDLALRDSGVDAVLFDLQDIGARFYTYVWSLYDLMCAAARVGIGVVVLDRPNPLGGVAVEGPGLDPACASFVGRVSVPIRHGLTVGELARWFAVDHVPAATGADVDVDVVAMDGWTRAAAGGGVGTPWVMPSPNMPTFDTVLAYPGTCLIEGTNLSEGRGTTRPFELVGAPYVDARLAPALTERRIPGALFRDVVITPTFGKHAGDRVRGVQLHVIDAGVFRPVSTGVDILSVVAELYPGDFAWRPPEPGRPAFIDLLWGSAALREGVRAGASATEILAASPPPPDPPPGVRLYT